MSTIEIYTSSNCGFCHRAKQLLDNKKLPYKEIDVSNNPEVLQDKCPGHRSVPQIFINDEHIGGFDQLDALQQSGELDKKLRDHSAEASTDSTQNDSPDSDSSDSSSAESDSPDSNSNDNDSKDGDSNDSDSSDSDSSDSDSKDRASKDSDTTTGD